MDVLRGLRSVVGKPWQSASGADRGRSAASGGNVGDWPLNCGGVADLVSVLRVVIAEVRVSKESRSGVSVVGQVIRREAESRKIHVVVVNLLRVHGTHQVRHLDLRA